jgi:hypothetical protein
VYNVKPILDNFLKFFYRCFALIKSKVFLASKGEEMAQFRKPKNSDQFVVMATIEEAEVAKNQNGGIILVDTKSGRPQWKHITHWSKPFDTENGLCRYGYPCDTKREPQNTTPTPSHSYSYDADEPF